MQTEIVQCSDPEAKEKALSLLENHAVIAAPTDTVYGFMCRYDSPEAIRQMFQLKLRPSQKAIPVLVGERAQLDILVRQPLPPAAEHLMDVFWPGPLTLVLSAQSHLPDILTAGQATVGVRMPDHTALCALILCSGPLAATSANFSGDTETHTAAEVAQIAEGRLPLILSDDHDIAPKGRHIQASTIVNLCGPRPILVRDGPIGASVRNLLAQTDLSSC